MFGCLNKFCLIFAADHATSSEEVLVDMACTQIGGYLNKILHLLTI